jgi:hypothetical protein
MSPSPSLARIGAQVARTRDGSREALGALRAYLAAMLRVGGLLPDLVLQDAADRELRLSSLHTEAPLAAIFLRHFG